MPSSTSNSDIRAEKYLKNNRWPVLWVAVVIIFVLTLGAWEIFLRYQGFKPSITDDWPVWSSLRNQANEHENSLVLVGASRILLGIDPALLQTSLQRPVFMLAIDGSDPLPVLENLADDEQFLGDVIISIPPYWLAGDDSSSGNRTEKWLRKYAKQSLSSKVETKLSLLVQANLAFRYSGLSPAKIWEKWQEGETVRPPYAPLRADRYRPADYSKTNLSSLRAARVERTRKLHEQSSVLDEAQFAQRISTIKGYVDRLHERGGKVFFVRFPSCGEVKEIEEIYVPRNRYWDVLDQQFDPFTLHADDYAEFNVFSCTDGSHLNYDDAAVFTQEMVKLLKN